MYKRIFMSGVLLLAAAACSGDIYLRDGVTDGDTFYLAQQALTDEDPALQSWVSYSLGKSACQLQKDTGNPARASSFECELTARQLLLQSWQENRLQHPDSSDPYLNDLLLVDQAGFLREYVARYFRQPGWSLPRDIRKQEFQAWQRKNLPGHRPRTVLTGSWNYRQRVTAY
jgi:hypothetical protein